MAIIKGEAELADRARSLTSRQDFSSQWFNILAVVVLGVFLVALVGLIGVRHHAQKEYLPAIRQMEQIRTQLTMGHLWFEEILAGDRSESMARVDSLWSLAEGGIHALLSGGRTQVGELYPLAGEISRHDLTRLLEQSLELRAVARRRLQLMDDAVAGSALDGEFDRVYLAMLAEIDRLDNQVMSDLVQQEDRLRLLEYLLVGATLVSLGLLTESGRRQRRRWLRHEHALRASEERFRGVFDAAAEGVLLVDPRTLKVVAANPAIQRILGYGPDELVGMAVEALHPEADYDKLRELEQPIRSGQQVEIDNLVYLARDGSHVPAGFVASTTVVDGKPVICSFITDRREELKARGEADQLADQLQQAQRMEAVGNLAGGIAHDFNNLLQAICGYADILHLNDDLPEDVRQDVAKIGAAAERAAQLTRQLLTFSRRQVIDPVDMDLNRNIAEMQDVLGSLLGETIELEFLPGNRLGTISLDPSQLEQTLMNLCINAQDAMGSRGKLTIETENVFIDDEYCARHVWARPGRFALLTVTDTGHGMDADTRSRIFEPFFTTKDRGKGTGLGLASVYGIVKQNGGMIHVYSEVDQGTAFKIYFPLVERAASAVGRKLAPEVTGGGESILIAEDDESVRNLVSRILTGAGYGVHLTGNGKEALEVLRANPRGYDLAILDVVMPEMGGREAQEAMNALNPDLKVLFASGYSQNAIHTDFVLDGGRHLLAKPYRRDELLIQVRNILDS